METKSSEINTSVKSMTVKQLIEEHILTANNVDEGRVLSLWSRAVGQDISRQTHPVSFRNGILFVETRHPVWTAELSSRRHSIRKKLNEALGKDLIREIHFRQARL